MNTKLITRSKINLSPIVVHKNIEKLNNTKLSYHKTFDRISFFGKPWISPVIFLLILIYVNIGPILSENGLIGQIFIFYCSEYLYNALLFNIIGYGMFVFAYYLPLSKRIGDKIHLFALNLHAVNKLQWVIFSIISVYVISIIWINWPPSNLWQSPFPYGYGQFEAWQESQYLQLFSIFALPSVAFMCGFLYRKFIVFRYLAIYLFCALFFGVFVQQSRGTLISVSLPFAIAWLISGQRRLGQNLIYIFAMFLLIIYLFNIIGSSRQLSGGIGIYNTYRGIVNYYLIEEQHNGSSFYLSTTQFFPESGDLHYMTKGMDITNNKDYMDLSEFMRQFDPFPSFLGRRYWGDSGGWFAKATKCYRNVGVPLPYGSMAYAGLGFYGTLLFIPIGILFRMAHILLSRWLNSNLKDRIIMFAAPLFYIILIISTLSSFAHGDIRAFIRYIINFWLFLFLLRALKIFIIYNREPN